MTSLVLNFHVPISGLILSGSWIYPTDEGWRWRPIDCLTVNMPFVNHPERRELAWLFLAVREAATANRRIPQPLELQEQE